MIARKPPDRIVLLTGVMLLAMAVPRGLAAGATPAGIEHFERKIRPLLAAHCFECHGDEKQKGGLRLDSPAAISAGGDTGPILTAGNPAESRLIVAVSYEDDTLKMPPKKRLPPDQVKLLRDWIAMGAPMPAPEPGTQPVARRAEFQISDEGRQHWAFQPVTQPPIPAVNDAAWVQNPIDAFILTRLEAGGLAPNPPASRAALIRRASYALTGLPPSPEAVRRFVEAEPADAWPPLVEQLLDSPHYGEKWARHWLDLVRYAESNSYESDDAKPNAWRYRDYVIRSLNADKPYDRFIREQLAGDELPDRDNESLIATGFYRLGIWDGDPADRELARYDSLDDIITTTGQVFLGLTVDCARCHNHKIDPISQADYYRFVAFFNNINHYKNGGPTDEAPLFADDQARAAHEAEVAALAAKCADTKSALAVIETAFREKHPIESADQEAVARSIKEHGQEVLGAASFARYQTLTTQLKELEGQEIKVDRALVVTEAGPEPPATFVLLRGNPGAHGEPVAPGFPTVLGHAAPQLPAPAADAKTCGRRLALANWIASPDNQLTARVMVNRIWQHHFGRGLVRSPNDFGLQGDRPTHPELLDWLASEFISRGWSLKAMHRLIMNSNAYRMSSRGRPDALAADAENQLFWRFNMRRLTAEEIRDSILAVTGRLNPKLYGPSIYVDIPKAVLATQSVPGKGWGQSSPEDQARRSIYIHVKRSLLVPILDSFDLAETDRTTAVRFASVQPTQALGMINSEFLNQQALLFADRLRHELAADLPAQVRRGFALATAREPTNDEVTASLALIDRLQTRDHVPADRALDYFCLMLLNLNEFIYLD
jgi:mono/diheme cytochrome c family protein